MNFNPNLYLAKVEEISIEILNENNIKALILDVDNTLIDYYKYLSEKKITWVYDLLNKGIKIYILSNTNKKEKVKKVADTLNLPYEYFAKKPSKKGFLKVQNILKMKPTEIAVVGDQIFTDVVGGNRCNMFTILVDPVTKKDYWYTAVKRPIESILKKKLKKGEINVSK